MTEDTSADILVDLFRSAWVVEAARAHVYRRWAASDDRFNAAATRADKAAAIMETALGEHGRSPDEALVGDHARWILGLLGDRPSGAPFAEVFVARLGDWVEAHAGGFLIGGPGELAAIGEEDRAALVFPTELPPAPPFEPVVTPPADPPGDDLFRFGILSDLHVGSPTAATMARAAITELNGSGAELVVQLGDITDHGDRPEFEHARKLLDELTMPLATMMGNHDVYSYEEGRLSGREHYRDAFGREPDGVILEHKGFRFAVLDSTEALSSPFPPFSLVTGQFVDKRGGAVVRGSFSVPQHDLLADIASPASRPAFVFLHHPPQPFTSFPPIVFGLRDEDSGRLHAACDSGNVWGVFAGHTHRNKTPRTYGRVPVQEVAIARDFPFGYALVDVTATGYAYNFHQLSDQGLLLEAYGSASLVHRRYATGSDAERAFVWTP
jgi:Calcineurin-like phosphoesterase